MSMSEGGDSTETKGERTRRVLLGAAITRFAREGYRATSVADIARDAGLSPTAAYAYFPSKEALFVAAVDEDAAGHIGEVLTPVLAGHFTGDWGQLITALLEALDRHPLARRVLAGLEPEFTVRLLGIAALEELRKGLGELFARDQIDGLMRADVNPMMMAGGLVTIVISLLISLLQTGADPAGVLGEQVLLVLAAAIQAPLP